MNNAYIGTNTNNVNIYVYFQLCPECKEPIIGVREQRKDEIYPLSIDIQGLALLTKKKSKE